MKFGSNKELVSFIGVVASVHNARLPLFVTDIGHWLTEHGYRKHIHMYNVELMYFPPQKEFIICISDGTDKELPYLYIDLMSGE